MLLPHIYCTFSQILKVRKDEEPEKKKIDRLHVKDVEFEKVRETKPRTDETEISCDTITSEKVTVSRRDITQAEETEKPRYPKDRDIGRIVIEEIPEQKEQIPMGRDVRKGDFKPSRTDLTVTRQVKDDSRKYIKEDVIKVGKLDVTELNKTPVESKQEEKRVATYTETVDGVHKV